MERKQGFQHVTETCCFIHCFLLSAVTEAGKVGDSLAEDFFREEYILNNAIGEFYKHSNFKNTTRPLFNQLVCVTSVSFLHVFQIF